MAAANRQLGRDLQIFSVGAFNPLASIRQCEVRKGWETQENRALKDSVHFKQPIIMNFQITFRTAVDTTDFNVASMINAVGGQVAVSLDLGGVTYGVNPALLESMVHTSPDGLQEIEFTISEQGVPLVAG